MRRDKENSNHDSESLYQCELCFSIKIMVCLVIYVNILTRKKRDGLTKNKKGRIFPCVVVCTNHTRIPRKGTNCIPSKFPKFHTYMISGEKEFSPKSA